MKKGAIIKKESQPRTAKGKENQLINLAIKLAEQKLKDGTASSQIITHFLSLATAKSQLEAEKLRADVYLSNEKARQIQRDQETKHMYEEVIEAIKGYQGRSDDEDDEYYEEDY